MYESFFDLTRRPFPSIADPFFYFSGEAIEDARVVIHRCLHRGEGTAMVVGPSGTGKTMLGRVLADQLADSFRVVFLEKGRFPTLADMLGTILHRLGGSHGGRHETELHLDLTDTLMDRSECKNGTVLIIDEAHGLTLTQLEELRVLTNLSANGAPSLRLMLIGASRLEERLAHPKLASFSQAIVARGYLEPLGRSDTTGLILKQFESAGGEAASVFPKPTCDAFYRATDGIPRLINQVCDLALLRAAAEQRRTITEFDVERAWAELQQLPTPWNDDARQADPSDQVVIEFGSLDDETTDPPVVESTSIEVESSIEPTIDDLTPEATVSFGSLDDDDDLPSSSFDEQAFEQPEPTDLIEEDEAQFCETFDLTESVEFPIDRGEPVAETTQTSPCDELDMPTCDDPVAEEETTEVELDFTAELTAQDEVEAPKADPEVERVMGSESLRFDSPDEHVADRRYSEVGDEVHPVDDMRIDCYAATAGFESLDDNEGDDLHRMLAATTLAAGLENQVIVQSDLKMDEIESLLGDVQSRYEPVPQTSSKTIPSPPPQRANIPNPFEESFDNEELVADRNGLKPALRA